LAYLISGNVKLDTDSVKSTPLESVRKWKAYNFNS
jgi:hypothetical protein